MNTYHPQFSPLGQRLPLHTNWLLNRTLLFANQFRQFLPCDDRTDLFLELIGLGKKCEQRITESLTELLWELYSVIWVEGLPNRNCFGVNSVIFLCVLEMGIFYWGSFSQRGASSWSRRYAERIWGDFFYFGPANFRKIATAGEFLSEFWWRIFRPGFSRVSGHPKNSRPKFTPRIVGIPLQFHFLEPKVYSRRFSAYGGDQEFLLVSLGEGHEAGFRWGARWGQAKDR